MTPNQKIIASYLDKHPAMATRTLAKLVFTENTLDFKSFSGAYACIRRVRGEMQNSKGIDKYKRTEEEKKKAHAWNKLPESDYKEQEPYIMPKGNNRLLILSDIHLPYHDVDALSIALEWGYEQKPNAII